MKDMICIVCPKGCRMKVDEANGYAVTGNECKRGQEYAIAELCAPVRMLTSTVTVNGGLYPRVSVKTQSAIPKGEIENAMKAINDIEIEAPVTQGQIIIKNICNSNIDIIATRDMKRV